MAPPTSHLQPIALTGTPLGRRLVWGTTWGLCFAAACGAVAILQFTFNHAAITASVRSPLAVVLIVCVAGCASGGAVVGACLPLARWKMGAAAVGFLAVLPVGILIQFTTTGWDVHQIPWPVVFYRRTGDRHPGWARLPVGCRKDWKDLGKVFDH